MSVFNLNAGSSETTPGKAGTIDDTTAVVADQPKAGSDGEQNGTVQTEKAQDIVIQGPLSHVYTQALNFMLAKESMGHIAQAAAKVMDRDDGDKPKGVYVYVTDARDMKQNEVTTVFSDVCAFRAENPEGPVVIGLEGVGTISQAATMLDRVMGDMGVKVYYRRERIMGAIRALSMPAAA